MNENNNNLNEANNNLNDINQPINNTIPNNNNQTNNDQNLFETREIKQIGGISKEEVDTSFVEPKKHHYFLKLLILLLVLVIGGSCVYYFVINTPKKFYISLTDKLTKNYEDTNSTNKTINENINYSIKTNITSSNSGEQQIFDVINKFKIAGSLKQDNTTVKGYNNIKYSNDELIDITYLFDIEKNTIYLKMNKILDKIIKYDIYKEQQYFLPTTKVNNDDILELLDIYIKDYKLTLETAKYERKITKLNNSYVFQDTLLLDNDFQKELLTKLLHDDEFLQKVSKISNTSISDVSDSLNNKLSNLNKTTTTVSVYRNILNNEIKKIEVKSKDSFITITIDNDKYNYEITSYNKMIAKGYVNIIGKSTEKNIIFNIDTMNGIAINIDFTYSTNSNNIDELNTKDAIEFDKLTEEDTNKIMQYIKANKALNHLLNDLDMSEYLEELTTM